MEGRAGAMSRFRSLFTKEDRTQKKGAIQVDEKACDKDVVSDGKAPASSGTAAQAEPETNALHLSESEPMHVYMNQSDEEDADDDPLGVYAGAATTSFGSVAGGKITSFGSDATDFDNLTSPGAQAEHNAEYLRNIGMAPYSAHALVGGKGGLLPESSGQVQPWGAACWQVGPHVWGTPYMMASGMPQFAGYPMTPVPFAFSDNSITQGFGPADTAADLQAHAFELERAGKQLLDMAENARAAALATGSGIQPPVINAGVPEDASDNGGGAAAATADSSDSVAVAPQSEEKRPSVRSHPSVYKALGDSAVQDNERTTVMLRNLPNDYTREMLLNLLHEEGFEGCYDFLYVPIDFKRSVGLGYAFVNLVSHTHAQRMFECLSGYTRWKVSSQKVLEVAWGAPLQGLDQHVERYKNSPLMHEEVLDEFKPMLFANGKRIPFPEPTKKLRPPRGKCCATAGRCPGGDGAAAVN